MEDVPEIVKKYSSNPLEEWYKLSNEVRGNLNPNLQKLWELYGGSQPIDKKQFKRNYKKLREMYIISFSKLMNGMNDSIVFTPLKI